MVVYIYMLNKLGQTQKVKYHFPSYAEFALKTKGRKGMKVGRGKRR